MKILIFILTISISIHASIEEASRLFGRGSIGVAGYRKVIVELVNGGYYYSAIPWMKEYLVRNPGSLDGELERAFDKILNNSSVKIFEALPTRILQRSDSGNIKFILAKKLINRRKFTDALFELNKISSEHPNYPFVAHLKATTLSYLGKLKESQALFSDCVRYSNRFIKSGNTSAKNRQLEINRDYCLAGMARAAFENKDYTKADLLYLDISKDSGVWPEILFEEAWNSYYQKNYNRTLGKLVSYKAPVFDFIFNPEVEVLKALTYLRMCLYTDAKKTVDSFYNDLYAPAQQLRKFIMMKRKDHSYFYRLASDYESRSRLPLDILIPLLRSVIKDAAYIELKSSLSGALSEYNQIRKLPSSGFKSNLIRNIKALIEDIKSTIGSHVRNRLSVKYADLYRSFEGMSYIKLEVLSQRKEQLYRAETPLNRKRGDVKYIDRNDKQYFWNFNGEFWADELGDYVFALGSEC